MEIGKLVFSPLSQGIKNDIKLSDSNIKTGMITFNQNKLHAYVHTCIDVYITGLNGHENSWMHLKDKKVHRTVNASIDG